MKSTHLFQAAGASLLIAALSSPAVVRAQFQHDNLDKQKLDADKADQRLLPALHAMITEDGPMQDAQQKVALEYMAADALVVKGKQYSADTSTESVQTLTDGNRITHRTVSKFYRDSEGRTRREETFGNVDPENPSPHEVKVFIEDPVAGTAYVLDPGSKTAEKVQHSMRITSDQNGNSETPKVMFNLSIKDGELGQPAPDHMMIKLDRAGSDDSNNIVIQGMDEKREIVKEDLGAKNIEGVDCTGTRKTITIPAGSVGNEKPISIVTETWYAPSISAVVQSTTDDPRYGKTTYQLSNLQTAEPSRSLFEPPTDFKLEIRK